MKSALLTFLRRLRRSPCRSLAGEADQISPHRYLLGPGAGSGPPHPMSNQAIPLSGECKLAITNGFGLGWVLPAEIACRPSFPAAPSVCRAKGALQQFAEQAKATYLL